MKQFYLLDSDSLRNAICALEELAAEGVAVNAQLMSSCLVEEKAVQIRLEIENSSQTSNSIITLKAYILGSHKHDYYVATSIQGRLIKLLPASINIVMLGG